MPADAVTYFNIYWLHCVETSMTNSSVSGSSEGRESVSLKKDELYYFRQFWPAYYKLLPTLPIKPHSRNIC